jgi:hypothetical protein
MVLFLFDCVRAQLWSRGKVHHAKVKEIYRSRLEASAPSHPPSPSAIALVLLLVVFFIVERSAVGDAPAKDVGPSGVGCCPRACDNPMGIALRAASRNVPGSSRHCKLHLPSPRPHAPGDVVRSTTRPHPPPIVRPTSPKSPVATTAFRAMAYLRRRRVHPARSVVERPSRHAQVSRGRDEDRLVPPHPSSSTSAPDVSTRARDETEVVHPMRCHNLSHEVHALVPHPSKNRLVAHMRDVDLALGKRVGPLVAQLAEELYALPRHLPKRQQSRRDARGGPPSHFNHR